MAKSPIKQTPGAIGYVEYAYAKLTKLPMASLENKAGKFIQPSLESGQTALAGVEMPPDLRAWLPDPEGQGAYPIVTYTWMLFYKKYDDPAKVAAIHDLVKYCLTEGQKISDRMGCDQRSLVTFTPPLELAAALGAIAKTRPTSGWLERPAVPTWD